MKGCEMDAYLEPPPEPRVDVVVRMSQEEARVILDWTPSTILVGRHKAMEDLKSALRAALK